MIAQVLIALCLGLAVLALWSLFRRKRPGRTAQGSSRSTPRVASTSQSNINTQARTSTSASTQNTLDSSAVSEERSAPEILIRFELIHAEAISDSARAEIHAVCAVIPDPHPIHRKLGLGLDGPEELAEIVASDAGLTASILRNVNSAAFSLASPIVSVRHAITYLGVGMVKTLVAQAAVADRIAPGTPEQEEALSRVWTSACAASAIAQ